MTDWEPTWADRQGYGRNIHMLDVAEFIATIPTEEGGGVLWKHVHFMATMFAENNGFYEWARPMVFKPEDVAHLSVDRGVCALNSYWWGSVQDHVAYDWQAAIRLVLKWLTFEGGKGTKDASAWDWRPLLDWQWHAYGSTRYDSAVPRMREAINEARRKRDLKEI